MSQRECLRCYVVRELISGIKPGDISDRKAVQITKQDFEINEFAWSPGGDEIALVVARTQKPEDSLLFSLVVVSRLTGDVVRTLSTNAATSSFEY